MSSATTEPDSVYLLEKLHSLSGTTHSRQKDQTIP